MENREGIDFKAVLQKSPKRGPGDYLRMIFIARYGRILLLLLFVGSILLPVLFIGTTSLEEPIEIRSSGAILPSKEITAINWIRAFRNVPLLHYLFNSTVTASIDTTYGRKSERERKPRTVHSPSPYLAQENNP